MSASRPPSPSQDADGARLSILSAARAEFAARGRDAASVHAVAARAGVTAAMINYYFGGKAALYAAAREQAERALLSRLEAALPGGPRDGAAALARRLAGAYFDFLVEERDLQRLLARELLDRGADTPELKRFVAPLRAMLAGRFGDDDEAAQRAISLFGAISGYFLYDAVLGTVLGAEPLSPGALARRRRHVLALATSLARGLDRREKP